MADAVADCTLVVGTTSVGQRDLQQLVKPLEAGTALIRKRLASSRVALLFGSEKIGLRNEDLSHCHWLMRIPTREEQRSMNLGQAVAICLYELARSRKGRPDVQKEKLATTGSIERLTEVLLDVLRTSGYLKGRSQTSEEKIRRLLRRCSLASRDAETLLGMLRQILWKIQSNTHKKS